MKKIAFLVPIYPPHFKYAQNIIKTWKTTQLNEQSDIWFIFTNEEEKEKYGEWKNSIILPKEFRVFENRGIINIKKIYGIKQLKNQYEYIIVLDAETEFVKNIDLLDICNNYFEKKELYGNLVYEEGRERTEKIKAACKEYFYKYKNVKLLDSNFYLWFNQPCIYKASNIDDFLEKIDYKNNITKLRWEDFDYYLYMYYLILFENFKIVDIGIDSNYGICETDESFLTFRNNNYLKSNVYMCSKAIIDIFDNPKLFLIIHIDRDVNWIVRVLNGKIINQQKEINQLNSHIRTDFVKLTTNETIKTVFPNNLENDKIKSVDLSVVVQGAIDKEITLECLKSIRNFLPDAEIILSTWQGSDVKGLDYDILVLNKDPGAIKTDLVNNVTNNQNRQLVSTREGIKKASRKYILKLRTDFVLHSAKFLEYWNKFLSRHETYNIFRHKIIASSVFSRIASDFNQRPILFHPSDFFLLGLADDLKDYFDSIRLATDDELGNWQYLYPNKIPYPEAHYRYAPEQFFLLFYAKQFFDIKFEDWTDWNQENIELSKNILYNNFIFLDYKQSGIFSEKFAYELENPDKIYGLISFDKYENIYQKEFDSTYIKEPVEEVIEPVKPIGFAEYQVLNSKFKKHLSYFLKPFRKIFTWIWAPIPILYNLIKLLFNVYFVRRIMACFILGKAQRKKFRGDV